MDYRRNYQPGGTFFFTVVTYRRQPLLADENAYELLRTVVAEVKKSRPFRLDAWVVLPDHLHMIWTLPNDDSDYSSRWSSIKQRFTHRWLREGNAVLKVGPAKQRERRQGVWQPKFYEHTIRDEDDFIHHVEYVHYNPVKHALAACPSDWPRSSYVEYVKRGHYPNDWCCSGGAIARHLTELQGGEPD